MVDALPIEPDGIRRAAEDMLGNYGDEALALANKRMLALRSEGYESLAKTWDQICAAIENVDGTKHT